MAAKKGSRGDFVPFSSPCRVKGQRPLWGLGQRPNCSTSNLLKRKSQQGAGSEASLPVTSRSRRSAPSCSFQHLCCAAPNGRDRIAGLATIATLPRKQRISPLRRRRGGNGNGRSPRSPFGNLRHRNFWGYLWLNFFVARGIAPAGAGISSHHQ